MDKGFDVKIEYSGPKPIISDHGISFKEGKEDKYSYLKSSLQILKAIGHEYEGSKLYTYDIESRDLSSNEMIAIVLHYHPDIEEVMRGELSSYEEYLDKEYNDVNNYSHLNEENKKTFLNNLKIMRDYRIQRVKNKFFYKHIIETIKEQIIEQKIKELTTNFNERFWHVFQTIQGELTSSKSSINPKVQILEGDALQIKMTILNNI